MSFERDKYLSRGNQIIFLATTAITLLLTTLSALQEYPKLNLSFWNNVIGFGLVALFTFFYLLDKKRLAYYYACISFVILAVLVIQWFDLYHSAEFRQTFLLNTIYIALLITMVAFITSKWFSLFFGVVYFGILLFFTLYAKDSFLHQNYYKLLVVLGAYIGVVFYFVSTLQRVLKEVQEFNRIIQFQNDEIQQQNTELHTRQEEILVQRDTLEEQKQFIQDRSKDTTDNLKFAKSIQESILPKIKDYKDYLPDSYILLFPKDEISGDFYWIQEKNGKIFIAAIDCTGHGASGALVSMIMYLTMNRVLSSLEKPTPSSILNKLDSILIAEFNKDTIDFNARIGMDIALVAIDIENMQMQYAGAINPLYLVRDSKLIQYKASRHLLGIDTTEIFNYFENSYIDIVPGDTIYLFSDGLPDQFGGSEGKKFGYKHFREFLTEISIEEMETQKTLLTRFIDDWKGPREQIDDILVIGIRF